MKVLAADIGGTNARLAICRLTGRRPALLEEQRLPTKPNITQQLIAFGREHGAEAASVAGAGPVSERGLAFTRVPVTIERAPLEGAFGTVVLMNDFAANAWALNILEPGDLHTIREGRDADGPRALLGAGTDLGKALAVPHDGLFYPIPGEGSTGTLPLQPEEAELAQYIMKTYDAPYAMQGHVLGGEGLKLLNRYFGGDGTADAIVRQEDDAARKAVALFIRLYARVARNLVLDAGAWGGCYLTGGIAQKNPGLFEAFAHEFDVAPRYDNLLRAVPIHIVANESASILGAAYALEMRDTQNR